MSSNTITVNPRKRTARSPPPTMKTDDTSTPKGTVLLRNPLPKYSFQSKLNKKETDKVTKDTSSGNKGIESEAPSHNKVEASKLSFELSTPDTKSVEKDETKLAAASRHRATSDQNSDLHIGVLVNSFPQGSVTFVNQSAESSVNENESVKKTSHNIEPDVVKTMIERTKPVNIVDPITCSSTSGTKLSHSYSESAIGSSSSRLDTQRELALAEGQGSASALSVSNSSADNVLIAQEDTGSQQNTTELNITDSVLDNSTETSSELAELTNNSGVWQYKDKIKHLEEEKQLLKQQLEVQLQVNCELKKLLVASVGEDLHHRVERLTRDRALMSVELGDYSKKLSEDYEHLDKISIQADMWRSKYLASRVMADELASAKAFYTIQYQECQVALQQLLNERHELRANLFETYRGLHQVRGAFDPLNSEPTSNQLTSKNVLDLARANQQLTDAIKYRLLPSHVTASLASKIEPDWHDYLTKAETHARELLARELRPEDFRHLVPRSLTAPMGMTVDRFHPCTRFDNLTINVCCKCKGDISIV